MYNSRRYVSDHQSPRVVPSREQQQYPFYPSPSGPSGWDDSLRYAATDVNFVQNNSARRHDQSSNETTNLPRPQPRQSSFSYPDEPNWVIFGRQMSQLAGDVSTSVKQNERIITLLERIASLAEAENPSSGVSLNSFTQASATSREQAALQGHSVNEAFLQPGVIRRNRATNHGFGVTHGVDQEKGIRQADPSISVQTHFSESSHAFQEAYSRQPLRRTQASHERHINEGIISSAETQAQNHGSEENNQIPSPVFPNALPAEESFASFELNTQFEPRENRPSKHMSPRSEHRQISMRGYSNGTDGSLEDAGMISDAGQHIDARRHTAQEIPHPSPIPYFRESEGQRDANYVLGEVYGNSKDPITRQALPQENDNQKAEWTQWVTPRPIPRKSNDPQPKYRSIKQVRLERKEKTNRPLATIGRIPLREYLELDTDEQYRSVRRLARSVYTSWLEQNVRLAKQDFKRVHACINKIEHEFPILADCEGHWKAKELMLQVTDNAIDEVSNQRKKQERTQKQRASDKNKNTLAPTVGMRRSAAVAEIDADDSSMEQEPRSHDPKRRRKKTDPALANQQEEIDHALADPKKQSTLPDSSETDHSLIHNNSRPIASLRAYSFQEPPNQWQDASQISEADIATSTVMQKNSGSRSDMVTDFDTSHALLEGAPHLQRDTSASNNSSAVNAVSAVGNIARTLLRRNGNSSLQMGSAW